MANEHGGTRFWIGHRQTVRAAILNFFVLLAAIMTSCENRSEGQPEAVAGPATEVDVVVPVLATVPRSIRVTGTLFGQEEATIAAKVGGRIIEIARDIGDNAAPGDLLARIDSTDFVLARDERKLALAQTLAELGLRDLPPAQFDVSVLPTVERSRLQAQNAQARYERGRQLFEQTPPLISEQDYSDLRTTWDVSEADHRVAALTAEALLAEARTLDAQLKIAEQKLADAEHTVPRGLMMVDDGSGSSSDAEQLSYVVAARLVSIGDLVQVGTPLFRLVDLDPVKLRAAVPERRAAAIKVGQVARLWIDAYPNPALAKVSRINPAVNPQTRTFEVEILAANPERTLNPGAFAQAEIDIGLQQDVLVIPATSVVTFAGVAKVFAVIDGKTVDRPVTLGERFGDNVEVVDGLERDEQIVFRPSRAIAGGMDVEPSMADWQPLIDVESASSAPASQPTASERSL